MFDRYEIRQGPSSIHVDVTEKRAPTDESVRLLREMEAKAFGEVLGRVNVTNNEFSGVLYDHIDNATYEHTATCVFSLNGKKYRVGVPVEEQKLATYRALAKAIAEEVAHQVLAALLKDSPR